MIPSALSHAISDPRLTPPVKVAYVFCIEYLDTQDWRPLKIELCSVRTRMKKDTVIFALRQLVEAGYIARGPRPHGEARHYRLLPAPLPVVKARAA